MRIGTGTTVSSRSVTTLRLRGYLWKRHYCNDKHWWVQAECVIGQIYLYRFHGIENAVMMAAQTWDYIKQNIVDYDGGEWFWSHNADGSVNRTDDKAGFRKCPYHNSRMCLEVYSILGEM